MPAPPAVVVVVKQQFDLVRSKRARSPHRGHGRKADTHQSPFHEQHIIDAKLGEGAFAQVFATRRKSDNREFASKVVDLRAPKQNGDDDGRTWGNASLLAYTYDQHLRDQPRRLQRVPARRQHAERARRSRIRRHNC